MKQRFVKVSLLIGLSSLFLGVSQNVQAAEQAEYVSITDQSFKIYKDIGQTEDTTTTVTVNQTFRVEDIHEKGIVTYLGIHDIDGLVGYIDASDTTQAVGPEGTEKIIRQYVKIDESRERYEDFDWSILGDTEEFIGQTFRAKAIYHHFNGDAYLSLYDNQDEWIGYVEESATSDSNRQAYLQLEEAETTSSEPEKKVVQATQPTIATNRGTMTENQSPADTNKHFIQGTSDTTSTRVAEKKTVRQVAATQQSGKKTWTNHSSFIEAIAPEAQALAAEYGLYPSVMIAQATLESGFGESLLAKEANNLFGIKYTSGDAGRFEPYNIPSDEVINGVRMTLPATFRKYETLSDSLLDNAKLLANGLSGNSTFYQGAWRKNAKSYQEATRSLTGKYATDPEYDAKLNRVIETWNLTQYD